MVKKDMKKDKKLFEHTVRVMKMAVHISGAESLGDIKVLVAAAMLHDIGRLYRKEYPDLKHGQASVEKSKDILKEVGYEKEIRKRILGCIGSHSLKSEKAPENMDEKILFDADKLDLLGGVGILRASGFWSSKDELDTRREKKSLDLMSAGMNGHIESMKSLKSVFYTVEARKLASQRIGFMDDFSQQIKKELAF